MLVSAFSDVSRFDIKVSWKHFLQLHVSGCDVRAHVTVLFFLNNHRDKSNILDGRQTNSLKIWQNKITAVACFIIQRTPAIFTGVAFIFIEKKNGGASINELTSIKHQLLVTSGAAMLLLGKKKNISQSQPSADDARLPLCFHPPAVLCSCLNWRFVFCTCSKEGDA